LFTKPITTNKFPVDLQSASSLLDFFGVAVPKTGICIPPRVWERISRGVHHGLAETNDFSMWRGPRQRTGVWYDQSCI